MANKMTKTVDRTIRRMYAVMATVAAQKAIDSLKSGLTGSADANALLAEKYILKAGADAINSKYLEPQR